MFSKLIETFKKTFQTDTLQGKTTNYEQRRYLAPRLILEDTESLPITRNIIIAIAVFLLLTVIWASIAKVDEIAKVQGKVIPRGQVVTIQHLEGGIVDKVLVQNGEKVEAGKTVLLELDPVATNSELAELKSKELVLLFDIERLRAFINDEDETLSETLEKISENYKGGLFTKEELKTSLEDEAALFNIQSMARQDQRDIIVSQVQQLEEELSQLHEQKEVLGKHIELLKKEEEMYRNLDSISKRDFLEVLRQANKSNGDLLQVMSKIKTNKIAILESKQRLKELDSKLKQEAAKLLDDSNAQLAQVRKTILRVKDKSDRLTIYSPVTGVVHDLQVVSGSVVSPGNKLLDVVPRDRDLIIEAELSPKDVGHVQIGDSAKIKITTYNSARYGGLDGKVELVSADTTQEQQKEPYYTVFIQPDKEYLGEKKGQLPISPGMTVEANIVIGEKTILGYLFKPIHRAVSSAFHER